MTTYTIEITDQAQLDALDSVTQEANDRAAAQVERDKNGNQIPGAVVPTPLSVNDYIQQIMSDACQGWAAMQQRKEFEVAFAAAQAGDAAPIKALADAVATAATADKANV